MILGDTVHLNAGIGIRYHAINEWGTRGRHRTVATPLCCQHNWTRFFRHGARVATTSGAGRP
jgi:hypothetical protein